MGGTCLVSSEHIVMMMVVVGDRCVSWVMRAWWWRWVMDVCGRYVVDREDDDVLRLD